MKRLIVLVLGLSLVVRAAAQDKPPLPKNPEEAAKAARAARDKGLEYLTKTQAKDGSWGKTYTIAVTSFACLAYLSASDEPFDGPHSQALLKGLEFLLANQTDGSFREQAGNSWIHTQGFATLALSETYGRSLFCKVQPDLDVKKIREVVAKAVAVIAKKQSTSGGWDYGGGDTPHGDTTACAVQALASANNFGLEIDEKVLDKGFAFLKRLQTKEGSFQYMLNNPKIMQEGTAANVAALALMNQFDSTVILKGYQFMLNLTPAEIGAWQFPDYGRFYGCMGMQLLGQQFKEDKDFREKTRAYIAAAQADVVGWQQPDGSFPAKGYLGGTENEGYGTAFAALVLGVPEARLSIYNRAPARPPRIEHKQP